MRISGEYHVPEKMAQNNRTQKKFKVFKGIASKGGEGVTMHLHYDGTKKLPDILDDGDLNRIFDHILQSKDYPKGDWGIFQKYRDITIIATTYIFALRPKEACLLKFSDIDMKRRTLRIDGKSNKRRKDRVLPIPKTWTPILDLYLAFPRKRFWRASEYLFPSFMSNHISPTRMKHIFREKVLKPLKLWKLKRPESRVPNFSLYSLRHSRASKILNKQIEETGSPDLYGIANILGHADLRSSAVYLHTGKQYREYLRDLLE